MDASIIMLIVVLVLFVVFMFVMPILTKKRNGQVPELYANLEVGDKIMTIGGIIGTVAEINEKSPTEKELLIETGAEGSKTTFWIDIKGIYQNLTKPPVPTNFFGRPKNPVKPAAEETAAAEAPAEETTAVETAEETAEENTAATETASVDPFADDAPAAAETTAVTEAETAAESEPAAKTESAAKTGKASSGKSKK